MSIMIVGLDNSGKTSVLNSLTSMNKQEQSQNISRASAELVDSSSDHMLTQLAPNHVTTYDEQSYDQDTPLMDVDKTNRLQMLYDSSSDINMPTNLGLDKGFASNVGPNILPTVGYNYERIQYKNATITVLDLSGQSRYRNLWQEFYNGVDAIVFVIDSSDLIRFVVARDELETLLSHPYFSTLSSKSNNNRQPKEAGSSPSNMQQKQITICQGKLIQAPLEINMSAGRGIDRFKKRISKGELNLRQRLKVPILFLANKTDLPHSVETEVIVKALNLNQLPIDRHPWLIQATSVTQNQGIGEAFDWLVSQLLYVGN